MKQIILSLKNKMRFISFWFIMFFLSEKYNWESLTLIYVITLEYLFSLTNCLEKMIHDRWLGVPMIVLPSLGEVLGILWIIDHRYSWINIISKFLLFSKIRLVRRQFLQIFCKKILRFLIIIVCFHPHLSELSWLWEIRALEFSCCASHN